MKSIDVELGGQKYEVRRLSIKGSREWRKQIEGPVGELVNVLISAPGVRLDDVSAIGGLLGVVKDVLLGSVDLIIEALFAYAPSLNSDRERIEEEADDEEALAAFVEVLKLAYPFGSLIENVSSGLAKTATKKS